MTASTEPVTLIADLFPGGILIEGNRPEGVPKSAKLHIILATTEINIGWEAGNGEIGSLVIPVTEAETADADHRGGQVGPYLIQRAGGCSCGKNLKRWNPYAGRQINQAVRQREDDTYGLPTHQRYRRD